MEVIVAIIDVMGRYGLQYEILYFSIFLLLCAIFREAISNSNDRAYAASCVEKMKAEKRLIK